MDALSRVVKEHYLRDDIGCGVAGCEACAKRRGDVVLQLSGVSSPLADAAAPELIVPDVECAITQLDVLEADSVMNMIWLQTVIQEVKSKNPPAYKRIADIVHNPQKQAFLFPNEFHRETYCHQQEDESEDKRRLRSVVQAVRWYNDHLRGRKRSSDGKSKKPQKNAAVVLVCDDAELRTLAQQSGVAVRSMKEHVASLPSETSMSLVDKLAACSTMDDSNAPQAGGRRGRILFENHRPLSEIHAGLKSGRLKQGNIQISRDNYLEANVFVDGDEEPVFIQGLSNLNRAVHGDAVAIEMLPREEWSAPAAILRIAEMEAVVDDEEKDEEDFAPLEKPRIPQEALLPTGRVVGIVRRNWRPYAGLLRRSAVLDAQRHLFVPADRRVPRIRIETRQADVLAGQRIVVSIDSWPVNSRYPLGHFVRSLGPLGDRVAENEVLLLEHDIPHHSFSAAVLACLPQGEWQITEQDLAKRTDLRHLDICSVDPVGCTDIDDALHAHRLSDDRLEVGVHIADVSHFVAPHTALDDEAAMRGTTVYLVDRRIDMLPDLLSSNLCSLRGGVERFAFSVIWEILEDTGEVLNVRFCKSIIRSRRAFTYAEAQMAIDDKCRNEGEPGLHTAKSDPVTKGLRMLNALAKKLKAKRHAAGALTLASLEIRFNIDNETHDPIDVQAKQVLETNSMVEEFMLLANTTVADKIWQEFPDCAVLRRHPIPSASNYKPIIQAAALKGLKIVVDSGKALSESLEKAKLKDNPYFNTMLRILTTRCMTQAVYFSSGTLEQSLFLHFGLAARIYTHFTSPIRRYADLLVHRLLGASIGASKTYPELLDKVKVQHICNNLNYRHKMAQYAGRSSVLLNTHLFFKDRVEDLDGFVLSVRKNAFQVLIPKYGLESAVLLGADCPLVFDADTGVLSGAEVTLRTFDPVRVQLSVNNDDPQHPKLQLKLIKPHIEGFSVNPIIDTADPD